MAVGEGIQVDPSGGGVRRRTGVRGVWRRARVLAVRAPWALPTLLAAVLRLWGIGEAPLGVDEGASLWFAAWDVGELWDRLPATEQHPPLYYAMLGLWLRWGDTEAHVRLLSALFSIATVPAAWALARAVCGRRAAGWAAWLMAAAPFAIAQGRWARMYGLLGFEAAVALWGCAWILKGARAAGPWIGYGVAAAAVPYTHNLGVLIFAAANAAWLVAPRRVAWRSWLALQAAVLAVWSFWAPGWLEQAAAVQGRFWIPPPSPGWVSAGLLDLSGGLAHFAPLRGPFGAAEIVATVGAFAATGAMLTGVWVGRKDRVRLAVLAAGIFVAPACALAATVVKPVFLARTLAWILAPAAAAAGLGLARAGPRARWALVAAIGIGHALSFHAQISRPPDEPFDEVARYIAERTVPEDAVIFVTPLGQPAFDYYFRHYGLPRAEYGVPWSMAERGAREPPMTAEASAQLAARLEPHPRVWLVRTGASRYVDPERRTEAMLRQIGRCESRVKRGQLEVSLYRRE